MTSNIVSVAAFLSDDTAKTLRLDASNARQEGRLEGSTAEFWDTVVARFGFGTKGSDVVRADIIAGVLTDIGEWSDGPQRTDGKRTPFGNVVQRFGARFDAAVKRATPEETKPVVLKVSLSGEGGGSTVVPADHPLYDQIIALLGESK